MHLSRPAAGRARVTRTGQRWYWRAPLRAARARGYLWCATVAADSSSGLVLLHLGRSLTWPSERQRPCERASSECRAGTAAAACPVPRPVAGHLQRCWPLTLRVCLHDRRGIAVEVDDALLVHDSSDSVLWDAEAAAVAHTAAWLRSALGCCPPAGTPRALGILLAADETIAELNGEYRVRNPMLLPSFRVVHSLTLTRVVRCVGIEFSAGPQRADGHPVVWLAVPRAAARAGAGAGAGTSSQSAYRPG
jgi:hypothetical protein